jgi:hypothetical protein
MILQVTIPSQKIRKFSEGMTREKRQAKGAYFRRGCEYHVKIRPYLDPWNCEYQNMFKS